MSLDKVPENIIILLLDWVGVKVISILADTSNPSSELLPKFNLPIPIAL